jgi:hypothetical protein
LLYFHYGYVRERQ